LPSPVEEEKVEERKVRGRGSRGGRGRVHRRKDAVAIGCRLGAVTAVGIRKAESTDTAGTSTSPSVDLAVASMDAKTEGLLPP
jgi:hypothetical protein